MPTEFELDEHGSQWVVQALARLLGTFAIIYGAFTVAGGKIRWSGPSFTTALTVPGAPATWGIFLACAGLVVIVATFARRRRVAVAGLGLIAAWAILFAGTFAKTWHDRPDASIGAALTSALIAGFAIILAAGYLQKSSAR